MSSKNDSGDFIDFGINVQDFRGIYRNLNSLFHSPCFVSEEYILNREARLNLAFEIEILDQQIICKIDYSPELYSRENVEDFFAGYEKLLNSLLFQDHYVCKDVLSQINNYRVYKDKIIQNHYSIINGLFCRVEKFKGARYVYSNHSMDIFWNHFYFSTQNYGIKPVGSSNRKNIVCYDEPGGMHLFLSDYKNYVLLGSETWMKKDLASEITIPDDPDLKFVKVEDEKALNDFIRLYELIFNIRTPFFGYQIRKDFYGKLPKLFYYIIYIGNRPVSIGSTSVIQTSAYIYNLGTDKSCRQKGYGRCFVGKLLVELKTQGVTEVYLQVDDQSAAEALYRKSGFKELFTRFYYLIEEETETEISWNTTAQNFWNRRFVDVDLPGLDIYKKQIHKTQELQTEGTGFDVLPEEEKRIYAIAAFSLLMINYLNQHNVIIGWKEASVFSFNHEEILPLKIEWDGAMSASDWLDRIRKEICEVKDHKELSDIDIANLAFPTDCTVNYSFV